MNSPTDRDFWFLPLGGCGEIGMNLNLFGHDHHWLMVDCGITFNADLNPTRVELPDPTFAINLGDSLAGIVLTHAHEDHIGACLISTSDWVHLPFTQHHLLRA